RDIDLFVGYDENGSGHPVESAERCRSTTPGVEESCMIEYPQAGKWWVLVQNWRSSAAGASDDVELELAVLTASDNSNLTGDGPGDDTGGELELQFAWVQLAMLGDEWYSGAVGLDWSADTSQKLSVVTVYVKRVGENKPQPTALFDGEKLSVV